MVGEVLHVWIPWVAEQKEDDGKIRWPTTLTAKHRNSRHNSQLSLRPITLTTQLRVFIVAHNSHDTKTNSHCCILIYTAIKVCRESTTNRTPSCISKHLTQLSILPNIHTHNKWSGFECQSPHHSPFNKNTIKEIKVLNWSQQALHSDWLVVVLCSTFSQLVVVAATVHCDGCQQECHYRLLLSIPYVLQLS